LAAPETTVPPDFDQILWHWRLFDEGPREGRAIIPRERGQGSTAVLLTTEQQVKDFVARWHGQRVVCFGVNKVRDTYRGGRHADHNDVPVVTHLFLDFDGNQIDPTDPAKKRWKPGQGPELAAKLIPRLEAFTKKMGFAPWAYAITDKGVHAYARVPPIRVSSHPDIAQRLAYLTTTVLRKEVADLPCKTDSVFDLSRVVKITGTAKPGAGISRFAAKSEPKLSADKVLKKYLLTLKLEAPADAMANDAALTEGPSPDILEAVAHSRHLRELVASVASAQDRSKSEFALTRELYLRGFRGADQVAKYRITIPGSKAREQGYRWTLADVQRIFRDAPLEAEADQTKKGPRPIDEWAPNVLDFVTRPRPPVQWFFPGLIAKRSRFIWAADPKTLKSMGNVYLALHAANMPHERVLYCAGEGDEADWAARIRRIAHGHGFNIASLKDKFRFAFRPRINLLDRETMLDIRQLVLDELPTLVIFDTMRSQMIGDENDSKEIGQLIANLDWLHEDVPTDQTPTIGMVHHTRKAAPGAKKADAPRSGSKIRGSSAIWGHVDTVIVAEFQTKLSASDRETHYIQLDVDHRMARADPFAQTVELIDPDGAIRVEFEHGESEGRKIEQGEKLPAQILAKLQENDGKMPSRAALLNLVRGRKQDKITALEKLIDRALVGIEDDGGVYLVIEGRKPD
jgi:hypothetical protein